MELNIWSRTILESYHHMERVVKSIDKTFMNICLSSRCSSWYDSVINSTLSIADKLTCLSERKILLINTKVLMDKVLSTMDKNLSKILILRFVKKYTNEDISKMYNVCTRTITRKCQKGLEEFTRHILVNGYTSHRIQILYGKERWLMDLYRANINEEIALSNRKEKGYKKLKLVKV